MASEPQRPKAIAVFCGSRMGTSPGFAAQAREVGQRLAQLGITVVYGGGHIGLMGAVADAAMRAGGKVIGVIPEKLAKKEVAHDQITELHVVDDMHSRKALMADLADGFLALPGGLGTLEESFEVLTWLQLDYHQKPFCFLGLTVFCAPA